MVEMEIWGVLKVEGSEMDLEMWGKVENPFQWVDCSSR